AVAAAYPHAKLLVVPDMGHAVLGTTVSASVGCVAADVQRFFAGTAIKACPNAAPAIPPTPLAPLQLSGVRQWPGVAGDRGRLVRAIVATLADVRLTASSPLLSRRGLRGGTFALTPDGIALKQVVYVPGIAVSGTFVAARGSGNLQIVEATGRSSLQL